MYYRKIVSISSELWKTLSFDPPLSLDNLDDYCGQKQCVSHALAQDFDNRRQNESPATLFFLWLNYPGGASFKPEYILNIISAKEHAPAHFNLCLYCNHDKFLTTEMKADLSKHNITIKILRSPSEKHQDQDPASKRLKLDNSIIRPEFMAFDTVKTALKKLKKEGSLIEDITALAYKEEDKETASILEDELTEMSFDTVFDRYFKAKSIGLDVDMIRLLIMLADDTPTIYMDLDIKVQHKGFFKPILKAQTVAAFISNAEDQPLLNNDYMKLSPEILSAYIVRILKNFCMDTAGECEWVSEVPKTSGPFVFMQTIADFLEDPERKREIILLPSGIYGEQGLAKNHQEQTWGNE